MNLPSTDGYPASPTSPDRPLPSVARPHGVSEVTPAKKITFFKSGDPQFSGVRMAINRRSFKSFSALMDDLSNKVPLAFGVRTITTPRGTHSINRLEQLQDGGSYICSDKKYVQPIARRNTGPYRAMRPISARRQAQLEEPEEEYSTTHFQQVPKLRKKVILVKNGDPTVRQSILLNRQNARNFKTFLEDASDLLQFTVRRIYTVDGRRIENIQAVLQSPNVIICAGKESFKPILSENVRKSITKKLPGLQSHHDNHHSEIKDNKKNSSFVLKAKKSVIHPRSASSNKTRLSLSSEKSYPNGLNMSPTNSGFASFSASCSHNKLEDTGHSLVNDDIEKKVHVNKDGSLSVEMKVRFRLLNEETLQWSTQIKKSSTSGKATCEQLCLYDENGKKENPEMFSEEEESFYPYDADSYSSKLNDAELDDMYCAHCGLQCEQYDIWKNPMHVSPQEDYIKRATWQTRSSASSTSSHHKLVCDQKTSMGSLHTMSSEEYTEHVVQQSSCYCETRENRETMVRYSSVNRSTSHSGQSTSASNKDATSDTNIKIGDRQQRSCSSRRSQMSLQNQQSQLSDGVTLLNSQRESFEDYSEASPTPCSKSNNCSQRDNMVSQSSLQSRKSERRLLKRSSANTKSFGSNISYTEDEKEGENNGKTTPHTKLSSSECTNQTKISNEFNKTDDHTSGERATLDVSLKSANSEHDNSSTSSSIHSKTSAKKCRRNKCCGQTDDQLLYNCSCRSSIFKQNSKKMSDTQESLEDSDANMNHNKSTKSSTKDREHAFQSDRSSRQSPVAESTLTRCQRKYESTNDRENCNKSSKSLHMGKSEECISEAGSENGLASVPISRSSSKSQSFSSTYINVSCVENEKTHSISSRASTASDKKSKLGGSSETCNHNYLKGSAKAMSQSSLDDKNANSQNVDTEMCNNMSSSETYCIHSPSPPKEKPTNKHLRSSQYKNSRTSISSDPIKNISGEKTNSSRSSTPPSKMGVVARNSTETCKILNNSVTSPNSKEESHNNKKFKNSTSSSKRKHNGESLVAESNKSSELTPSALPNVTPEEVVNEWLRKIPSQTVVEYESEECKKKASPETKASKMDNDEEEHGELNRVSTTKVQNNDPIDVENGSNECHNNGNDTADANVHKKEENVTVPATNPKTVAEESHCDKKSLPNNIQTSVHIMKALLNPLQDSKYDRSNSLPEVSQTMGRKLSNSAKVLISCLASLQLLEDGPGDPRKNSNDINKYNQLLNILQALWAEGPTNNNITSIKSAKHFSREDELTPVSSSGVDINSGFDGSGDGSVTGAGDSLILVEKLEDCKLSAVAEEVNCTGEMVVHCEEEQDTTQDDQPPNTEASAVDFEEARSCVMDENMNEKKISNSFERDVEATAKECEDSNTINNLNNVDAERIEDCGVMNAETMNNTNHGENETKSNEHNSQESSDINSPGEIGKSSSDLNGKPDPTTNEKTFDADPAWVLNLLKKIEREFMTHYVDAMNEFKVRWNLESNENLDEMIAELKNEVGQRIQKSISNELKKINSRGGIRVPKPPDGPRRKTSLQAEERRMRLQTMHQRSIRRYANSECRDGGTNDLSCETDEEDLTFSASIGDDSNGQNDEFCPCEKCIKQKRALKQAKSKSAVTEAPIMKAFDLQQILKMKRGIKDPEDNGPIILSEQESDVASTGKDCTSNGDEEKVSEDNYRPSSPVDEIAKSDISGQDHHGNEPNGVEDTLVNELNEVGKAYNADCESSCSEVMEIKDSEEKNTSTGEFDDTKKNGLTAELDDHLESDQGTEISMDCKPEEHNTIEEQYVNQLVDEPIEPEDDLSANIAAVEDECFENGDCCVENGTMNPAINFGKDSEDEETEADESCASYFQKSLARGSLITQNGSTEDIEVGCQEANNTLGETSPNGQSNSSGSKQSQMYPDSTSEEEAEDSPRASPVGKNESTGKLYVNGNTSFEDHDSIPKKNLDDLDDDDLDF
ncbi:retinitis pigmentosa 1-like 1 protein [Gastrophryne carolinensis]